MDRLLELTRRAEVSHFWFRGFRQFVRPLVERAARGRTDLRILDCGCGTGVNLPWLSRFGAVSGMDLTASGLAMARAAGRPLVRGDAMRLPYRSEVFDLVTSFDVVACLPGDRLAFREMARVLRPGGHLVLNTTALDLLVGDHSALAGDLRRYTPGRLRQCLAEAGLEPVIMRFGFASTFPIVLAIRLLQRWRRGGHTPGETEISVPAEPVNGMLTGLVTLEALVARVMPMPFGSSLRVLARKPVAS